jgi:UDP-3-O-[3-hydroxymyristoyl] glucosamine N-acyltransferase
MNLNKIVSIIGGDIINGDQAVSIKGVASPKNADPEHIIFIFNNKSIKEINNPGVIVTKNALPLAQVQILHPSPRLAIIKMLHHFYPTPQKIIHSVCETARVKDKKKIQKPVNIHAFVSVEADTHIEKNTIIHANVSIGKNCQIGEGCTIHPNVVMYNNVTIGNNTIIHSGAVIGADGFGYENDDGVWRRVPQVGSVVIGDNVEIGSNTSIDRGSLDNTVIHDGVKIDNLVQVGHNCNIGAHSIVVAGVLLGGSVSIGKQCIIAGDAKIKDGVCIGDNAIVMAQSAVTKNIKPGSTVSGYPARKHTEEMAEMAKLKRLLKKSY